MGNSKDGSGWMKVFGAGLTAFTLAILYIAWAGGNGGDGGHDLLTSIGISGKPLRH